MVHCFACPRSIVYARDRNEGIPLRRFFVVRAVVLALCTVSVGWFGSVDAWSQEQFPKAVQIDAPDRLSTRIYAQPAKDSEIIGIALQGGIYEVVSISGDFVEIHMADSGANGYILMAHTQPWAPPPPKRLSPVILWAIAIGAGIIVVAGVIYAWSRVKKTKVAEVRAASIPASIKRAEELFRAGEYSDAIGEFRSYLQLQGGDVRNPDVYRRLSVCYQNLGEIREAAKSWEKMRDLGGLKGVEDYALGVSIMMALGKEVEAAHIYEQLLETEMEEEKRLEIHETLYETYRKLKDAPNFLRHGTALMQGEREKAILAEIVSFLVGEGKTDVALEAGDEKLIKAIAEELLEEKAKSPSAARIFLKALDYNRTDKRLHGMLSQIYAEGGDYRRAVSELTILYQLDKGQNDQYIEQAARLYLENSRVQEAVAEGNPLIIKKLAQLYLARSEVNPDAVAVYEKVLEFQPKAIGINKMLSTVYLTRGDLNAYMEKLRVLHEIDGANHDYLTDLAKCVIDNDLVDRTIREGNRELNSKILKQLIKSGASDDGTVELFERLVKYEPNNVPIRSALVSAYEKRQEYRKFVEHALALIPLREDAELIEKVAAVAAEHNLIEDVARSGIRSVIHLTGAKMPRGTLSQKGSRGTDEKQDKEKREDSKHSEPKPPSRLDTEPQESASKSVPTRPEKSSAQQQRTPRPHKTQEIVVTGSTVERPVSGARHQAQSKGGTTSQVRKTRNQAELSKPGVSTMSPDPVPGSADRRPGVIDFSDLPPLDASLTVEDPLRRAQYVDVTDPNSSFAAKSVTTFVSGYSTSLFSKYREEELFYPATGGLAYKDLEILFSDGWSHFHVGAEVNTGRSVLMRIFRRDLFDPLLMREFMKEVTDLGFTVTHDNILPLQEPVTGPTGARGLVHPFYSKHIEHAVQSNKLGFQQAMNLFDQILSAVSYAHNHRGFDGQLQRTYHLHIQPCQVLVSDDLTDCKMVGLGYSQVYRNLTRASKPRWQEPGMNPATMPPEFFRSKAAKVRERHSEIYSLGVLLYFMATGEYPFEGPSFEDFKFQHSRIHPSPPTLTNSSLPPWLDRIVLGCLEKDPEKRWDTVTELHAEFRTARLTS